MEETPPSRFFPLEGDEEDSEAAFPWWWVVVSLLLVVGVLAVIWRVRQKEALHTRQLAAFEGRSSRSAARSAANPAYVNPSRSTTNPTYASPTFADTEAGRMSSGSQTPSDSTPQPPLPLLPERGTVDYAEANDVVGEYLEVEGHQAGSSAALQCGANFAPPIGSAFAVPMEGGGVYAVLAPSPYLEHLKAAGALGAGGSGYNSLVRPVEASPASLPTTTQLASNA